MNGAKRTSLHLALILALLLLPGCYYHSPGGYYYWTDDAELVVHNDSPEAIYVYVDDYPIGTVSAYDTVGFWVVTGTHEVSVREYGHTVRYDVGLFTFYDDTVVEVVWTGY